MAAQSLKIKFFFAANLVATPLKIRLDLRLGFVAIKAEPVNFELSV